ncbi:TetR/AcrR family transcriptional regulator [Mycolicibacterium austroafricanum]|uniref:TetR/AcrR family transcriptional regulator n=1 Tax=Mycolicibacterium austroafricanum TaxID=39687 RepID=UPI001CA356F0|nr:TetR/AcrR family transcriptional regulator [Mycolicibacterium austroafricanum]QZT58548.1 TetR/AcrR family transcriptional regulator [Mycolicibacterium austroafricanum]
MADPSSAVPAMRKDFARNRARILEAAREVYLDQGLGAPNDAIIAKAGVGATTFYRHFPTREILMEYLLRFLSEDALRIAEEARDDDAPWDWFEGVFRHGCVLEERETQLFECIAASGASLATVAAMLAKRIVGPCVRRAHQAGVLSSQLDIPDIVDLMSAAHGAPDARRRALRTDIILAGIRNL